MTPESALATIPGFSNAWIGITLADGPTNKTVLVENFESQYVLRVDKPVIADLGLDRRAEEEISRMVASAGLAPELVYTDHERGIALRKFVPGTNWLVSDLRKPGWLKRLAALLRELHALPEVRARFEPDRAIRRYAEQLGTDQAKGLADRALALFAECRGMQDGSCLCHNDLLNHNIMESTRAMLIDWEYAGMGDPYFDLAVVIEHHKLGEKLGVQFLGFYLERKATEKELERLWKNCAFYAALLELWTLRVAGL